MARDQGLFQRDAPACAGLAIKLGKVSLVFSNGPRHLQGRTNGDQLEALRRPRSDLLCHYWVTLVEIASGRGSIVGADSAFCLIRRRFWWSRDGESNPGPAHYERAQPTWLRAVLLAAVRHWLTDLAAGL